MLRLVRKLPIRAAGSLPHLVLAALAAGTLLVPAIVHAADAEQTCRKGRYTAAAKYSACQQKALAKYFGGASLDDTVQAALSKCRVKYAQTWPKLQAKASGTGVTCDNSRYDTTSAGTVIDRLTGLQWEKKTDDATVHDRDNAYTWADTLPLSRSDGSAFTSFLAELNGECFAGQCDWRLPTIYELQTILLQPYPCTTSPCFDQAVFGSTAAIYWSATTLGGLPFVWFVNFNNGIVYFDAGNATFVASAVRGGL